MWPIQLDPHVILLSLMMDILKPAKKEIAVAIKHLLLQIILKRQCIRQMTKHMLRLSILQFVY